MTVDHRLMRALARSLAKPATQTRTRHMGVVAATSPLTVYLDGGAVAVPAHTLSGYVRRPLARPFGQPLSGDTERVVVPEAASDPE